MTISEMTAILRGEVKFYDSPEDVQSKLNKIADELERLSAERDAAVADIKAMAKRLPLACNWCVNDVLQIPNPICLECDRLTDEGKMNGCFEWRGVKNDSRCEVCL